MQPADWPCRRWVVMAGILFVEVFPDEMVGHREEERMRDLLDGVPVPLIVEETVTPSQPACT